MGDAVAAGDLGALDDTRLAAAGEYTALAALVRHATSVPAMNQLVAHAMDEDAFRWVWALVNLPGKDELWASFASNLPAGLTVPENLEEEVAQFVLVPWSQPRPRTGRAVAQEQLLGRLEPASSFARRVAHRAVGAEPAPPPAVVEAALDVLGASSDSADRRLVLNHAETLSSEGRPESLLRLTPPFHEDELKSLLDALGELTQRGVPASTWGKAALLAVRLPVEELGALLAQAWPYPNNKRELFGAGFVGQLGTARLRELLEQRLGDETTIELLAVVPRQLAPIDLGEFGRWAHTMYPAKWLEPVRMKVVEQLSFLGRYGRAGPGAREELLGALWAFALASVEDEPTALLAGHLRAGELWPAPGIDWSSPEACHRLGRLAGHLLVRDDGDAFEGELQRLLEDLGEGASRDRFLEGLAQTDAPGSDSLPIVVSRVLLRSDVGICAFAAAGHGDVLVSAAGPDPTVSVRILRAAGPALGPAHAQRLSENLSWRALGDGYHEAIEALRPHPPVLFAELDRALTSLAGPEAAAVPPPMLTSILEAALDEGLRDQIAEERTIEHLVRLLGYPDHGVVALACSWIRRLDLDGPAVNTPRAEAVLSADVVTGGTMEPLRTLRGDLAQRLAQLAGDVSLAAPDRAAYLRLATKLMPSAARMASLGIVSNSTSSDLRVEAARILATTDPDPDHESELRRLLDRESNTTVRASLQVAVNRIHSGSVGEALLKLADLVGLHHFDPGMLRPEILLPDAKWHDAFVKWTDSARVRAGNVSDPGTFIEAAINLGDRMVEEAIVARFDVRPLKGINREDVDRLRTGLASKPDTGSLLRRQGLIETFPWFATHSALRQLRGAHPTPANQTTPLTLGPDDLVAARTLLRTITSGWIEDMHATASAASNDGAGTA